MPNQAGVIGFFGLIVGFWTSTAKFCQINIEQKNIKEH